MIIKITINTSMINHVTYNALYLTYNCLQLADCLNTHSANTYRKNSNIIRTIFTKNKGQIAGVRIIHVN